MAELVITQDNFEEEVLKSDIPVLIDFWASWCAPCRMLAPAVEAIAEEYQGKIKVGKINVDEEEALAVRYKVSAIPYVVAFKNGEVVGTSVGLVSKEQLIRLFQ